MNILIYGAGAIGSLFGALLSKHNVVNFIGRKAHVEYVNKYGLHIEGKTILHEKPSFFKNINEISEIPDLVIITVKSFDTEDATRVLSRFISSDTLVLSFQNGLNNIDAIARFISEKQIIAGITSHGAIFTKPGHIRHTGIGKTRVGELSGKTTPRIKQVADMFCTAGVDTLISPNIQEDIWKKAIVNASINPLTAIFQCKNGYLLKNPLLKDLASKICIESTGVATASGLSLDVEDMLDYTFQVIQDTEENTSSMLQSIMLKKKTEIESINGTFVAIGNKVKCSTSLNDIIVKIIEGLY